MTSYIVSGKYQELFNKSNDFDYILCASKEIGEMGLPPSLAHAPFRIDCAEGVELRPALHME